MGQARSAAAAGKSIFADNDGRSCGAARPAPTGGDERPAGAAVLGASAGAGGNFARCPVAGTRRPAEFGGFRSWPHGARRRPLCGCRTMAAGRRAFEAQGLRRALCARRRAVWYPPPPVFTSGTVDPMSKGLREASTADSTIFSRTTARCRGKRTRHLPRAAACFPPGTGKRRESAYRVTPNARRFQQSARAISPAGATPARTAPTAKSSS